MAKVPMTGALSTHDAHHAVRRCGVAPRTTGVPVLPPDATDDAWLAVRRRGVSASELAAVIGMSPHESPFSLWWKKQEDWPNQPTMAMHIGHKLEAVIAELWAEAHPDASIYRPGARLWAAPQPYEFLTATPDYLAVFDESPSTVEPLECKSDEGGKGWGPAGSDEVPEHHRLQVWQQCYVFGASRGHIMRLSGKRPAAYVIPFGTAERASYVALVATEVVPFMAMLESGVAPDIDGHDATTYALIHRNPAIDEQDEVEIPTSLAHQYRQTGAAIETLRQEYSTLQNRIRALMGRAQYAVSEGGRVAERRIYKKRGYSVPPCTVDSLHRKT